VTLRPGEVAILQFKQRLSTENVERIRRQWQEYTGGKPPVVLDGDIRVGGKIATESYDVPAVPL
jgi:hypothetical protein